MPLKKCLVTKVSDKKHPIVGKTNDLSQDLTVEKHNDGNSYGRISDSDHCQDHKSGSASRKISDRGVPIRAS